MNSVNDILNNVPPNNFLIFKSIKEKFSTNLIPLRKKVVIVAIAVFSCYALVCLSFSSCFKKMGKPILDRLADNCKDAIDQQAAERPREFNVNCPSTPTEVNLTKGLMPIHGTSETINGRLIGTAFCQGRRQAMEDTETAETGILTIKEHAYHFELCGVFDGHGGSDVSNFVKKQIKKYLIKELEDSNLETLTDEGIFIALKKCFKKLDADYHGKGGTTATVAFIIKDEIWVANVGDSRTILVNADGITTQASEDAKPEMDNYAKKIRHLGGWLVEGDTWRVNGRLAVARAIGDKHIKGKGMWGKCCVSPSPKITRFDLNAFKGGYLVLACDGLYDVASTNEVGDAIHQMAQENELSDNANNLEEMGRKLVYQAIYNGSKDNVTVMIVKL